MACKRIEFCLMVNKNNLPKVSINILSAIAVILSFVFLFTTFRYYDSTFLRYLVTIGSLAAVSSFALVALIRVGVKVDNKMASIPQKNKRVLYTLLAYLVIPAICGVGAGIISLLFATGFGDTWGKDASFGVFFIGTFVVIPFAFGVAFVYLGAIVNALSRWAAGLIWRESEAEA